MSNPPLTASEQRVIVNEVLASSKATHSELPALGPPEIVREWERLLAEWKESIEGWFDAFLARQDAINPEYISALFTSLGYSFVVLVLALILFAIFQYIRKRTLSALDDGISGAPGTSRLEGISLQDSLSDSLARGAFAAALRIRWKIFLARTGQAPSVTPRESQARLKNSASATAVPTLEEPMFSGRSLSLEEYDARHNFLLAAEGHSHGD
jgi:hypothetical protein